VFIEKNDELVSFSNKASIDFNLSLMSIEDGNKNVQILYRELIISCMSEGKPELCTLNSLMEEDDRVKNIILKSGLKDDATTVIITYNDVISGDLKII
jgi:hypothetical protein